MAEHRTQVSELVMIEGEASLTLKGQKEVTHKETSVSGFIEMRLFIP